MKGPFVPLAVAYRQSDKMLGCSPLAELLFVRALAFSKGAGTEGFIRPRQAHHLTAGFDLYEDHSNPDELIAELEREGLWQPVEGGWLIEGWLDWNGIDASRAGTFGNHVRWHVTRGQPDTACQHCAASGAISPRVGGDSQKEERREEKTPSSTSSKVGAGEFDAWWNLYPRKVCKQEAVKAYAKARRAASVTQLTESLQQWKSQWDREARPLEKIPHAATWLNAGRYLDDELPTAVDDDEDMKLR